MAPAAPTPDQLDCLKKQPAIWTRSRGGSVIHPRNREADLADLAAGPVAVNWSIIDQGASDYAGVRSGPAGPTTSSGGSHLHWRSPSSFPRV